MRKTLQDPHHATSLCARELSDVARGAGATLAGRIVGGGLQFLYTIVVVRLLGAESFGLFMIGLTVISVAGVIGRLGLESGVVRFIALHNGSNDTARIKGVIIQSLLFSLGASLVIGAALCLSGEALLGRFFHRPDLGHVIRVLSLSLPFAALMFVALSATQGFRVMRYTVYGQHLFWPAVNTALVLAFAAAGWHLSGVVAAYVISLGLTACLALYFLARSLPALQDVASLWETGKLLRFSMPLLSVAVMNFLFVWTDTLMLGYFRTTQEVGIYNAAMKTALLTSLILVSFNAIFAPMISDLHHRKEIQKVAYLFKCVTKWVFSISLAAFLVMLLLCQDIMAAFGQEFISGWPPLVVLALAQLVNAGVGSVGVILVMSGRQTLMMHNMMGATALNLCLNYLLVPSHGIWGAAVASAISITTLNLLMLVEVYWLMKIHPYNRHYYRVILCGFVTYCFFLLLDHFLPPLGAVARILIYTPLFLASFLGVYCLSGVDPEDRYLFGVLRERFHRGRMADKCFES